VVRERTFDAGLRGALCRFQRRRRTEGDERVIFPENFPPAVLAAKPRDELVNADRRALLRNVAKMLSLPDGCHETPRRLARRNLGLHRVNRHPANRSCCIGVHV
jgi:hypothetical protein